MQSRLSMIIAEGRTRVAGKEQKDKLAALEVKDYTGQVLKQVEENYSNFVRSQITYHEYLMNDAEQKGNPHLFMHHKVMLETYQTMLANARLSNRYSTVRYRAAISGICKSAMPRMYFSSNDGRGIMMNPNVHL